MRVGRYCVVKPKPNQLLMHLSVLSPRGEPRAYVGHLTFQRNFGSKSPDQIKCPHLEEVTSLKFIVVVVYILQIRDIILWRQPRLYAPINVKPQGGGGGLPAGIWFREPSPGKGCWHLPLPQGREFDMSAILEDRENLEISQPRSHPEVTRSYRFLHFASKFWPWAKER